LYEIDEMESVSRLFERSQIVCGPNPRT